VRRRRHHRAVRAPASLLATLLLSGATKNDVWVRSVSEVDRIGGLWLAALRAACGADALLRVSWSPMHAATDAERERIERAGAWCAASGANADSPAPGDHHTNADGSRGGGRSLPMWIALVSLEPSIACGSHRPLGVRPFRAAHQHTQTPARAKRSFLVLFCARPRSRTCAHTFATRNGNGEWSRRTTNGTVRCRARSERAVGAGCRI
jgi:hypothetical protein